MKRQLLIGAAVLALTSALRAQSINVTAPGYGAVKLFEATPGYTITGLGAAPTGDVFYLENDGAFTAATKLYRRTPGDGFTTATPIFDFGAALYGSFVVVEGTRVYFGESSTGTIRAVNLDGGNAALIGTVINNYDLAFFGGQAFVSANPDPTFTDPQNHVYRLDLATGATDSILNATPDYSGPIGFDAAGNLLYGASKSSLDGIYRFNAQDLANVFGPTELTLVPPANRLLANGGNQYLAVGAGETIWEDDSSFTSANSLTLHDLAGGTSLVVATAGSASEAIGHLDYVGGELYTSVTDFGLGRSAVFKVVPEPASALLGCVGALALAARRRRA